MDAFLFHSFSRLLSLLQDLATFDLATLLHQNIVIGMAEKCVDFKLKFFDIKNSLIPRLQNLPYFPDIATSFFGFSDFLA